MGRVALPASDSTAISNAACTASDPPTGQRTDVRCAFVSKLRSCRPAAPVPLHSEWTAGPSLDRNLVML
jgi:hypothetical protein